MIAGSIRDVFHQEDVYQLVEAGFNAATLVVVCLHGDGHAGNFRLFRAPHGERVNVEGAPAEERRHSREDAGLVFYVHHKCFEHRSSRDSKFKIQDEKQEKRRIPI